MDRKERGAISSLLGKVSGRSRLEEEIKYRDNFTGLPNGHKLRDDFSQLKSRAGYNFALIRINGIQQVATLFDFGAAERTFLRLCPLLQEFAGRYEGRVYRLALDRFALLVPAESQSAFEEDLKKLLVEMERVNVQDKQMEYSCHYTFSYGVYPMTRAEDRIDGIEPIMALTDSVVGRLSGGYSTEGTFFNDKSKPKWELQGKLKDRAHQAWENREFVPFYQLVYDLKDEKPVGAETLTRWQHPGMGLIMPGDFLPVMESEGLIMDLDLYMLEEACKKIKGWIDNELITVPLSINISKLNIHRKNFMDQVIAVVEKYQVPPVLIELELAEGILVFEKNNEFLEIAKRLHDIGFCLSMDNFASSDYGSLNLLRDLEMDVIKMSPRFFDNVSLEKESRDRTFVKSVIGMIKHLGIRSVAMGVETREQVELVKALGCDYAQGYYFSKPISNEEFEKQIF